MTEEISGSLFYKGKEIICTGGKCVLKHIKKHRRAYIRGSGVLAGGIGILKIITVIVAIYGLSFINAEQIPAQEEQMLLIFYQIEDIGHQRETMLEELGYQMPKKEEFDKLEEAFHATQDFHQKYEIAKKMDEIMHLQDDFLNMIGYKDPVEDKKFHDLENQFK